MEKKTLSGESKTEERLTTRELDAQTGGDAKEVAVRGRENEPEPKKYPPYSKPAGPPPKRCRAARNANKKGSNARAREGNGGRTRMFSTADNLPPQKPSATRDQEEGRRWNQRTCVCEI